MEVTDVIAAQQAKQGAIDDIKAKDNSVEIIDLLDHVCQDAKCSAFAPGYDGIIMFQDQDHLNGCGASFLVNALRAIST